MIRFPIKTTGDVNSINSYINEINTGRRYFIWSHVTDSKEREQVVEKCKKNGLIILKNVDYFVLACSKKVTEEDKRKMILHVLPKESEEQAQWVGKMFGYNDEEIGWYLSQLKKANSIRERLQK